MSKLELESELESKSKPNPNKSVVEIFDDFYKFPCPHCGVSIVVAKREMNCRIFRCGQFKHNGVQIPQHAPEKVCDILRETDQIYGCAKPFIFKGEYVEQCGYI